MMSALADLTIYSNASLKGDRAGFGYVAVHAHRMLLGSGIAACGIGNSYQAEVSAAEAAIEEVMGRVPGDVRTVDLVISNGRVGDMFARRRLWVPSPIGPDRVLRVFNIEPYSRSSTGAAYANAVAHKLAGLGRGGDALSDHFAIDRNWRNTIVDRDQRLDPDPRPACMSGKEAAAALGVGIEQICEMVRDGRLSVDQRTGKIPEAAVIAIRATDRLPQAEMLLASGLR